SIPLVIHSSYYSSFPLSFCKSAWARRVLHSFPTRRSSDLGNAASLLAPSLAKRLVSSKSSSGGFSAVSSSRKVATVSRRSADRVDRKSTRLNSSHVKISYAVLCLKKKIAKQ